MNFENDIFISYAHLDEQPLQAEDKQGWISAFHTALAAFVGQYTGKTPKIWRDSKLQGNDTFSDEIIDKLEKAAVLVSILSPRYVESDWCSKEVGKFYELIRQGGKYPIANKSRVFKVLKFPVELEKQVPKEIQELLGYEFYKLDPASKRPIEIRPEFGSEAKAEYFRKVADLAYDIKGLLETIETEDPLPEKDSVTYPITTVPRKTIYLAQTTFDLNDERDSIKRELQQRGYTVLPDPSLPYTPELAEVIRENLERCTLSIHLIGERYGTIPEGASQSIVALQNELATKYTYENPSFPRLIWMPIGLQAQEQRQEEFIKFLQDGPGLLQTSLEELKTIILDKLNNLQKPQEALVIKVNQVRQVYLICDQRDLEAIEPLYNYLYEQGVEVILPVFEGDAAQVRQEHQDNLLNCDALIIYYGIGSELWLRAKLRELQKAAGYCREKPMLAQAIYVSGPETKQKQLFRTHESLLIIKNMEVFSPVKLEPFLNQINQREGG